MDPLQSDKRDGNISSIMKLVSLRRMDLFWIWLVGILISSTVSVTGEKVPVLRLPANTLLKYTSYKDVSILHYQLPANVKTAYFTFKAVEESKSAFQRNCDPRNVSVHLKAGSYPVISPENITFPKHFLNAKQRFDIYHLEFPSNGEVKTLNISGPNPGNWFAVAFINWTDPSTERIEQQGLAASCDTNIISDLSIETVTPIIIHDGQTTVNKLMSNSTDGLVYKFFVPKEIPLVSFNVVVSQCIDCEPINIQVDANRLPSKTNRMEGVTLIPHNIENVGDIELLPRYNAWHYITIQFETPNGTLNGTEGTAEFTTAEVRLSLMFDSPDVLVNDNTIKVSHTTRNIRYFPMLRQTFREFFLYDFDLIPNANGTVPTTVNITNSEVIGFNLRIGDAYDIGGTLTFALAMIKDMPERRTYQRPALPKDDVHDKLENKIENSTVRPIDIQPSNQTLIVCMNLGEPGIPMWPDGCIYGNQQYPAVIVVNNTNDTGVVHVPFPETGQWFVTVGLFCDSDINALNTFNSTLIKDVFIKHVHVLNDMEPLCPCTLNKDYYKKCFNDTDCITNLNDLELMKLKDCYLDPKCNKNHSIIKSLLQRQTLQTDVEPTCNGSFVFTLSSNPCVAGRCGKYGRCYHYMSGGFVFSTCVCTNGYRGWDCSDDSQVPSNLSILTALLLLTLSNLLFLPSIYFAIRRKYLTEAVIYFFAMFFSIFYHACDSGEDQFGFCLVKISVLQFCDFYCGLLAIWVTLIAMAHLRQTLISLLHMGGAILLAFGTEWNKQSLWVFLAPALTGLCLISASWSFKCRRTKKWFPARQYLAISMPLGAVLVMIGLVCYAFLQTKQNYHIVHSIWHMVMALSILCLLPNNKTFIPRS